MKIMQLTDLHFGKLPFNENDEKTMKLIENLVKKHSPQLIVITGDLIWSKENNALQSFQYIVDFFDDFQIPFAVTLGNHDSESDFKRLNLWEILEGSSMHVKKEGEVIINGCCSYFHTLNNDIRLYLLDAGDYAKTPFEGYAYVTEEMQNWLLNWSKNRKQPDQLFTHIPLPEYILSARHSYKGNYNEEVCAPLINSGLWYKLYNETSIESVYCGHDHDNDFESNYFGIQLCYGRVTGYNTYGKLNRGARIIEWNKYGEKKSYIVTE